MDLIQSGRGKRVFCIQRFEILEGPLPNSPSVTALKTAAKRIQTHQTQVKFKGLLLDIWNESAISTKMRAAE